MLILLFSTQKSYFCDNDAIYELFIMKNRLENDVITKDIKPAGIHLLIITILDVPNHFHLRQIDRANFAVRGLSSMMNCLNRIVKANYLRSFVLQTHFF